ncbi:MAG: hypothetical protein ACREA9_10530, partial [Pyrinomonadaceae bacterium]
ARAVRRLMVVPSLYQLATCGDRAAIGRPVDAGREQVGADGLCRWPRFLAPSTTLLYGLVGWFHYTAVVESTPVVFEPNTMFDDGQRGE